MVELPPEMTKNFGVTARKFSTKTATSTDKDRSVWTDSPADRARKEQVLSTCCKVKVRSKFRLYYSVLLSLD